MENREKYSHKAESGVIPHLLLLCIHIQKLSVPSSSAMFFNAIEMQMCQESTGLINKKIRELYLE